MINWMAMGCGLTEFFLGSLCKIGKYSLIETEPKSSKNFPPYFLYSIFIQILENLTLLRASYFKL